MKNAQKQGMIEVMVAHSDTEKIDTIDCTLVRNTVTHFL